MLDVKTAGLGQAQRLRARSFLMELFERAALFEIQEHFGVADVAVLVRGGGGFTMRLPSDADPDELERLAADLQQRLWTETGGEVRFALGWGRGSTETARASLERQKRQPARALLQQVGQWTLADRAAQLPRPDACDFCGNFRGPQTTEGERRCSICAQAERIGSNLPRWDWMRPAQSESGAVQALGVNFNAVGEPTADAFRVSRWIPHHTNGHPLLFREIAAQSSGDRNRLAVLKADVDDMGVQVGKIAGLDASYGPLRDFSRRLHAFFVDEVRDLLEQSYPLIYTIYAGGDDLLLVGPWDITLDFAGDLRARFEAGPGQEYGLTFSAGIHLTHHGIPIRHAVDRAETLLEQAKGPAGKNRCAALGAVWQWERHNAIIAAGKRLAQGVESDGASRSLLHRLLQLVEDNGAEQGLRAARWSYQIARNLPQRRGEPAAAAELRAWAQDVLPLFDEPPGFYPYVDEDARQAQENAQRLHETAASLRYALLATRRGRGDTE